MGDATHDTVADDDAGELGWIDLLRELALLVVIAAITVVAAFGV